MHSIRGQQGFKALQIISSWWEVDQSFSYSNCIQLLTAVSDAFWLTMSSELCVCVRVCKQQQPEETRSFSSLDRLRRSRLETHRAANVCCVHVAKSQDVIHTLLLFFYLPHKSGEHASSGDEIHRETGGGAWACNFLLQFSLAQTLFINTQHVSLWDAQSSESCNIDTGLQRNNKSMWQDLHRWSWT